MISHYVALGWYESNQRKEPTQHEVFFVEQTKNRKAFFSKIKKSKKNLNSTIKFGPIILGTGVTLGFFLIFPLGAFSVQRTETPNEQTQTVYNIKRLKTPWQEQTISVRVCPEDNPAEGENEPFSFLAGSLPITYEPDPLTHRYIEEVASAAAAMLGRINLKLLVQASIEILKTNYTFLNVYTGPLNELPQTPIHQRYENELTMDILTHIRLDGLNRGELDSDSEDETIDRNSLEMYGRTRPQSVFHFASRDVPKHVERNYFANHERRQAIHDLNHIEKAKYLIQWELNRQRD